MDLTKIIEKHLIESNNTPLDSYQIIISSTMEFQILFSVKSIKYNFYASLNSDNFGDIEVSDYNDSVKPQIQQKYDPTMGSGIIKAIEDFSRLYSNILGIKFSSKYKDLQKLYATGVFKRKIEQITKFKFFEEKQFSSYKVWYYKRA